MSNLKERPLPEPDPHADFDDSHGEHAHYPRLAGEEPVTDPDREDLALELGDFLHRIPQHLLREGPHDVHALLYFDLGQVAEMLARGDSNILLGDIYDRASHIFHEEPLGVENVEIRFPWQKVLKLISESDGLHEGAGAPESLAHKLRIRDLARTQAVAKLVSTLGGAGSLRAVAGAGGRPRFWVRQPAGAANVPVAPPAAPVTAPAAPAPAPVSKRGGKRGKKAAAEAARMAAKCEPSAAAEVPAIAAAAPEVVPHPYVQSQQELKVGVPQPEIVRSDREYRRQIDELNRRILALEGNQRERTHEMSRETELRLKAERQLASAERALEDSACKIEKARVDARHQMEAELHRRDDEIEKLRGRLARLTFGTHGDAESDGIAGGWQARMISQMESDVEMYRERIRSLLVEREKLSNERDALLCAQAMMRSTECDVAV